MAACQNGAGAKKGRKKLYECQVQFVLNQGHQVLTEGVPVHTVVLLYCNLLYHFTPYITVL